jgi:hypothetical protein
MSDPSLRNVYMKGETTMKLTPPKTVTWWISIALGVLGLLGYVGTIAVLSQYAFWLVLAGLVLLVLATLLKDL